MVNRKAMACLNGEAMAFKLGRDSPDHARALELPGAQLFDPSGMGRPFKRLGGSAGGAGGGVALTRGSRPGVHHGLAATSKQGPKAMPVTDFG